MEQQENELEQARREIDAVDAEMAALFCRRMDAVRRVAAYKQARGLPVLDASREEAVVAVSVSLGAFWEYAAAEGGAWCGESCVPSIFCTL